jgi:hypothetical protein
MSVGGVKHIGGLFLAIAFLGAMMNGCTSEEACDCIRSYGKTGMSSEDIQRLMKDGISACFTVNDSEELADESACLPAIVGTDARNGKSITVEYTCSDVCPDAGGVHIAYDNVSEGDCCSVGGKIATDPAWGAYVGCVPPEVGWSSTTPCP